MTDNQNAAEFAALHPDIKVAIPATTSTALLACDPESEERSANGSHQATVATEVQLELAEPAGLGHPATPAPDAQLEPAEPAVEVAPTPPPKMIEVIECANYEDVNLRATQLADSTTGIAVEAVLAKQEGRTSVMFALPGTALVSRVVYRSCKKRSSTLEDELNRPLDDKHVENIRSYIQTEDDPFLPPVVAAPTDVVTFLHAPSARPSKVGLLVIPSSARFVLVDGQHRCKALDRATDGDPQLRSLAMQVVLVDESDPHRIRALFVQCSKNRSVAISVKTAFGSEPSEKIARALAIRVLFWLNKIEWSATNAKPNGDAPVYFTIASVKRFVEAYLTGTPGTRPSGTIDPEAIASEIVARLDAFHTALPGFPPDAADEESCRSYGLYFSQPGLTILGALLHGQDTAYAERLAALNWSRDHGHWPDVVGADGRLCTGAPDLRKAVKAARLHLTTTATPAQEAEVGR